MKINRFEEIGKENADVCKRKYGPRVSSIFRIYVYILYKSHVTSDKVWTSSLSRRAMTFEFVLRFSMGRI